MLMEQVLEFCGRLHPMFVHAPIGLLIGLVFVETVSVWKRKPMAPETRSTLAWLAAVAAASSIGTGLLLRREDGYTSEMVDWHQWLGIGLGSLFLLAAILQQKGKLAAYRGILGMAAVLFIPVGHYGASLTHGENFLMQPFMPKKEASGNTRGESQPKTVFVATIAPILEKRCVGCHGENKDKGGLRLHTPEAITDGGDLGPVFIAFKPQESSLVRRMLLPLNDEDHMPPKSKPQPDAAEIEAVRAWIAAGASFTSLVGETAPQTASPIAKQEPAAPVAADPEALAAIRRELVHVAPISQDSVLLEVDFAAVAATTDDERVARLLTPIKAQITDLSLARSKITNASLKLISELPQLRRLDISSTAIDDAGLAALKGNKTLEELVVTRTGASDAAIMQSMPALRQLYCWGAKFTTESVATLKLGSKLLVEAGNPQPVAAVEVEPQPVFAAKPKIDPNTPSPAPVPPSADALKPINDVCPVSGKPISLSKLVVYKGRVIGLCCEHCAEEFLANPEKYESKLPK
jgi:uncharacterized membrane protein